MSIRKGDQQCISFREVFSPEQLAEMRRLGEAANPERGATDYGPADYRKSSVAFLHDDGLGELIGDVVKEINAEFWGFRIAGLEPLQYTRYDVGDTYGWHVDRGPMTPAPRKLSFSIQLSSADEYEGGDLLVNGGDREFSCSRELGAVIAFPSWVLHRVTPVLSGVRRSLVVWAHGPQFV